MALKVYNTLTRRVEEFKPLSGNEVKIYICGLTVYDYMHIGHARTYVAFDAILRYLIYSGYRVKYVQNVTDIDDKIIRRAKERGIEPLALASDYSEKSALDRRSLGLLEADAYPTVSENMDEIITGIKSLIDKGYAYVVEGDVYFEVPKFPDYGRLSGQGADQLRKQRIEPNPKKKNPTDFSIWKISPQMEMGFPSPWGIGRPGWHIECSVLAKKYLGEQLDIHGGALDLVFPHHENEIAQSESLTGKKPYVRYWMHTGFLNSSGEKMSKSLGNIISIREFLKSHSADALRLFVLQTHYRSPVDYSTENISKAESAVNKLAYLRRNLSSALEKAGFEGEKAASDAANELRSGFIEAMDDDFNTPKAAAALFDFARGVNRIITEGKDSRKSLKDAYESFNEVASALGLILDLKEEVFSSEELKLIEERNMYRKEKNWDQADKIRAQLLESGIRLTDGTDGETRAERV